MDKIKIKINKIFFKRVTHTVNPRRALKTPIYNPIKTKTKALYITFHQ